MANTRHPSRRPIHWRSARLLLLFVILLAFVRLTWRLDAKDLWLDETFSLQRAEASWPELLAGCLPLTDGVMWIKTTDQHPFAYFIFLGLAVRTLDQSEFALRFPSAIAAMLVVPSLWYENSPVTIQEAFAVREPVIASRLGALAEKVQDGVTGRLFAAGDSADLARVLGELAAQPEQLTSLRAHIRPGPDIAEHAQRLVEIYLGLRKGSKR